MRLEGKVAIVTGGAVGIGKAICERYAKEGAKVVVADIREDLAKEVAAAIGSTAIGIGADVTRQASIDGLVAATVERFGRIDILVNNAGIFTAAPLEEITHEQYARVFAVNVEGVLFTAQAVAKHMMARKGGGKIINLASQAGRRGEPLVAVYCASKAAVISLTQSMALYLAPHGINVNAIAPGVVDTPQWAEVDAHFAKLEGRAIGEKKAMVGKAVPLGRMGVPEDMTGMALFLASADSDYVTAQTYNVDGGNWMN